MTRGLGLERGLTVPLVYNTGGYERVEMLAELEGLVEVYMPDMKFADTASAERYLGVSGYPERSRIVDFLVEEVAVDTDTNVMGQYHPAHRARELPGIARRPRQEEINQVISYARSRGMSRIET